MIIRTNLFPEGRKRAMTFSYDDAPKYDKELIDIFNRYGMKGTFHANSCHIGEGQNFTDARAKEMYRGHELSVHTLSHPCLYTVHDSELYDEIMQDRKRLEEICGYTVRGMSYPYGHFDEKIVNAARFCGMRYARTTRSTNDFNLPADFLMWHPTCHHNADLDMLLEKFLNARTERVCNMPLFYIWGHSYEFDAEHNNDLYKMENFCKKTQNLDSMWYATNIEIYDYVKAAKELDISAERKYIFNPSRLSVWVSVNDKPTEIKPGENCL